jgi:hypothetical protein
LHQELATQAGREERQMSARDLVKRSLLYTLAVSAVGWLLVAVGASAQLRAQPGFNDTSGTSAVEREVP